MRIILSLIMAFICSVSMAQEVVTKLDTVGQGIINEELRRTRKSTSDNSISITNIEARFTSGILNISNGGTGQTTAQAAIDSLTSSSSGTNGQVWTTDGTNGYWSDNKRSKIFTVSGSWTAPDNTTFVMISMIGGGGGGGGGDASSAGGGGGSGAYIIRQGRPVTPSSIYTVTVGVGGSGGNTSNGGNGGTTSFTNDSVTISVNGGSGGTKAGVLGAGGAISGATTFDANLTVQGGYGVSLVGGNGGTKTSNCIGGAGGGSPFGIGGTGSSDCGQGGSNGIGFGSGGGGGADRSGVPGGNGADGFVYLEW